MERLTMRITGGKSVCEASEHCDNTCDKCLHLDRMIKKLADYEDAEEQGLLLRLPVAVGEEVYCIANFGEGYEICKNYVTSYQTAPKEIGGVIARGYMGANLGIVGKTVFATKEEAESALAEKGGA